MNKLQDIVSKKYETKDVGINISNGTFLTVSLINSKYNDSTATVRQQIAYEIGKIVLANLNQENKIEVGRVSFVESHNYVVYHSSKSFNYNMRLDSLSTIDTTRINIDSIRGN